jgi:hypothetical protein
VSAFVYWTELGTVPVRLLEVVATDLVELGERLLDPLRETLVQVGPLLFGNRFVGRVAQEQVLEPERLLARWTNEVLPDE